MQRLDIPFNISILKVTPQILQSLKPVKVLDYFEGGRRDLHDDGLFSTSTFGRVGDEIRGLRFSYIDVIIPIMHPVLFRALCNLKQLYGEIISGSGYAVWDNDAKDFIRSNAIDGETGYSFFEKHWNKIVFVHTRSPTRTETIKMVEKYRKIAFTDKVLVSPAGKRDIEINEGRVTEDEVNGLYRTLLAIANTIFSPGLENTPEAYDIPRFRLQLTFNKIYAYHERMLDGKKKFLQDKWSSRRPFNGTANVISGLDTTVEVLGDKHNVGFNDTVIGLYQFLKAVLPVSQFYIRNGFLSKVFRGQDDPAQLVNKKTLKLESVKLKTEYFDRYMTDEGVEQMITLYGDEGLRHQYLEIGDHYIGLIYKGPDMTFKVFQDIDELPEGFSRDHVHPITFCELLYLSLYKVSNRYPLITTRYPCAGLGSTYPSKTYLKTTIKYEIRTELNEAWERTEHEANSFPIINTDFVNTLIPHSAKLAGLKADFDGDRMSANALYTDEAIRENEKYFTERRCYIGPDGKLLSSIAISPVELMFHNLSGGVNVPAL